MILWINFLLISFGCHSLSAFSHLPLSSSDIDAGVKKPGKLWEQQETVISSRQTLCHFHKSSPARWPCIGLHYFKHQIVLKITIILICEIWKRPYLLNREKEKNENKKPQFTFLCVLVSYFSCYCNLSAQQIYNLEWGSGVGTNFIIFLRGYGGKQRRPYEKAEDWVWWFLYGGYYWHVRWNPIFPTGMVVVD